MATHYTLNDPFATADLSSIIARHGIQAPMVTGSAPEVDRWKATDLGLSVAGGAVNATGSTIRGTSSVGKYLDNRASWGAIASGGLSGRLPLGAASFALGAKLIGKAEKPINTVADAVQAGGSAVLNARSDQAQREAKAAQFTGNLADPSAWGTQGDATLFGTVLNAAEGAGSMLPVIASGGAAMVTGALMSAGAGAEQARQEMGSKSDQAFLAAYPQARQLVQGGMSLAQARQTLTDKAAAQASLQGLAIGAVGGKLTGSIIGKGGEALARKMGTRWLAAPTLGVVGAAEEGVEELAEGVAAKAAINQATGGNASVMEDSFGNFMGGVMAGGPVGVGKGLLASAAPAAKEKGGTKPAKVSVTPAAVQTAVALAAQTPVPTTSPQGEALRAQKVASAGPLSRGVNTALDRLADQADGATLGQTLAGLQAAQDQAVQQAIDQSTGRKATDVTDEAEMLRAQRMAAQGQDYYAQTGLATAATQDVGTGLATAATQEAETGLATAASSATAARIDPQTGEIYTYGGTSPQAALAPRAPQLSKTAAYQQEVRQQFAQARTQGHGVQEAQNVPAARQTHIITPARNKLNAQWDVVEVDTWAPTLTEGVNPARERTRAASEVQVASIANNPDYDSLSDTSKTMDYGAPTLAADGLVVAGQARLAGLSRAYGQGTATAYRQSLEQDAARLGLDPERVRGMQKPVLVRRVSATALPATQHPIEAIARSTKGLPQTDQADFATQAEQPQRHDDPRTVTGERAPAAGAGQLADGPATSDAGVEATAGQVRLNQNGKPLPKRRAERLEKKEAKGQAKQETDFVPAPGGGLDYGEITPDMGKAMRRQAGKIRLRVGNAKWGLTHINARHLADFKALGFASAQDFVAQVAEGFSAIYKGKGVALDVVLPSERHGMLIVSLAPSAEGDFYDVKTATPTRGDQFKNQSPLWDRTGPSASGSTNAAPSFPKGQSGAGSVAKAEPSRKPAPYTDKADKEALLKTDKALVGKAGLLNLAGRKLLRTPWEGMDAGERGRLLQLAEARTPAKGQEQAPKKTPQALDFGKRSNAQLAEEYERLEGTDGGHSIDADEARELSAEYRAERSRAADIHAATSRLVQYLYRRALARPVAKGRDNAVLFLAGGGGSGKSTVRKNVFGGNTADITLDGTFSDLKKARANIAAALATGREVVIIFVYRPVGLAAKNVIDRALRSGRSVPIEALVKAHVNAAKTVQVLAKEYNGDNRVKIRTYDNGGKPGEERLVDINEVPHVDEQTARNTFSDAVEQAYASGKIPERLYRAFRGRLGSPVAQAAGRDAQANPRDDARHSVSATAPDAATGGAPLPYTPTQARSAIDRRLPGVLPALEQSGKVTLARSLAEAQAAAQAARQAKRSTAEGSADYDYKRSAEGRVQGFYDPVTGKAYLVTEALTDPSASAVLLHEVGVHMAASSKGMEGLFARAWHLVQTDPDPELREVARRMEDAGETSGEEAAAYIVEHYAAKLDSAPRSIATWLRAWKGHVLRWLLARGAPVGFMLSPADMVAVAKGHARRMAQQARPAPVIDRELQVADVGGVQDTMDVSSAEFDYRSSASSTSARWLEFSSEDVFFSKSGTPTQQGQAQIKAAEQAYGGKAAYDKAKKDGKTKLTYGQWLQVRTPNFKAWFGDWEAVRELTLSPSSMGFEQASRAISALAGKNLTNLERGIVAQINAKQAGKLVSEAAVKKTVENGFPREMHYAAAANIAALWKHAELIEDRTDSDKDPNIQSIKRFAVPIVFKGDTLFATLLAKESLAHGHRVYTVELLQIEALRGKLDTLGKQTANQRTPTRSADAILQQLRDKVNPGRVSKVTDPQTGEPMVVYHGGTVGNVFSLSANGKGSGRERAFFFTPDLRQARDYAGTGAVKQVFLSLQKPLHTNAQLDPDEVAQAKGKGHDGYWVVEDGRVEESEIAVFNPNQMQSALGNNGNFSPSNDDIRYSKAAGPRPSGSGPRTVRNDPNAVVRAVNALMDINLPMQRKLGDYLRKNGREWGGVGTWWAKSVGTMQGLAVRNAHFKTVYDAAQAMVNHTSKFASRTAALAPTVLPTIDSLVDMKDFVSGKRSALTEAQNTRLAKPVFEGTLRYTRDSDGKPLLVRDALLQAQKMDSKAKADALLRARALHPKTLAAWQGKTRDEYKARIDVLYARHFAEAGVVWSDSELRDMWGLDDKLLRAYHEVRSATNQSLADLAKSSLVSMVKLHLEGLTDAQVNRIMDADTLPGAEAALRVLLDSAPDLHEDLRKDLQDKSADLVFKTVKLMQKGYAPLSRFGDYTLDVVDKDGKRLYFGMFDNKAERTRMQRTLQDSGAEFADDATQYHTGRVSKEARQQYHGVSPETAALFGEFLGLDPTGDSAADKAWQGYLQKAVAQRSALKRLIHRKGIEGYSEDVGRVLAGFITSNARQAARSLTAMDLQRGIAAIPKGEGELADHALRLRKYLQDPQEEAQAVKGLMFVNFIGGSLASAAVNLTQTATMTAPWLSQYVGMGRASWMCAKATKDAMKSGSTGDAELDAALEQASDMVSPQEIHQLMKLASGGATMRGGDGTRMGNAIAKGRNVVTAGMYLWGVPFSLAEQLNRRTAFIAAWRVAKDKGLADPIQFARATIEQTQGVYNKANKAQFARRAGGGLVMTFKQYSVTYVEMLQRMWTQGGPEGKRAVLFALAMVLLLSGFGGLPFADDIEDVVSGALQRMGYNVDTRQLRDEFIRAHLGDVAADFAANGITGYAGSPFDLSGRIGLGNLVPCTGLFTTKRDHSRDVVEVLGPAGSLAAQYFDAGALAIQGDYGNALLAAAPLALKNAAKGLDMAATGVYRDTKGRTVVQVDSRDAFVKAIGFQPAIVKRVQDATSEVYRAKDMYSVKRSSFVEDWAEAKFMRDSAAEAAARARVQEWNRNNPDYPMSNILPFVLRKLKEKRMTKIERILRSTPKALRANAKAQIANTMEEEE